MNPQRPRNASARYALRLALLGAVVASLSAAASVAHADADAPQALAQRFAPVVRLVSQAEECGPGEPYAPSDVDALLGNPDVALRGPWLDNDLIKIAPTGDDLARASAEDYLDFPGNPLKPGCDYERWVGEVTAGKAPTVYAHVATEPGRGDRLALQYWLYYPFNDYNNKHESDWEMIQLEFAASDPAAALAQEPIEVAYSQHEGAEVAGWHDPKLEILGGTHPVVHAAAGSHANYYDSALYLGRSGEQGFGCDNTTAPTTDVQPVVKLIPTDAAAARSEFPWIVYQGHWGQHEDAFYNGPTGPSTKESWTTPISWQEDEGRDLSYAVPAGGSLGTAATDFFCTGVASGSSMVRVLAADPLPVFLLVTLVAVLLVYLLSRATWRPSAPLRLARRRAWGQTITAAARMYRSRLLLFIGIGALTIPVSLVVAGLQKFIVDAPELGGVAQGGEAGGWRVTLVALLTFVLMGYTILLVHAATARALVEIDASRRIGVRTAYTLALRRWSTLLGAFVLSSLLVGALTVSVVLVPVAVVLIVLFAFYPQTAALEDRSALASLRRSVTLVRRRFWKVASLLVAAIIIAAAVGPLLGTLLLLTTNAAFPAVNVVAGITYALLMPFVALTVTYAYFDAAVRTELDKATPPAQVLPEEVSVPDVYGEARPTT